MRSKESERRYPGPQAIAIAEPFRLAALGTATYLSYWRVFFAFCEAMTGRRAKTR